jgi:hypothetical protein
VAEALLTGQPTNESQRRFKKVLTNRQVGKEALRKSDGLAEGAAQLRGETDDPRQQLNVSAPALFVAGARQADDAGDTAYQFMAP